MTRNKAPKTAARERMAQTGEPYSVARRATASGNARPTPARVCPSPAGRVRARTRPEADGAAGAASPDWRPDGGRWTRRPAWPRWAQPLGNGRTSSRRARRAAAGLSAADIEARTAAFRVQEAADRAKRAAEQARERADRAEAAADQAEERAMQASDAADQAEEWADPAEQQRLPRPAAEALQSGASTWPDEPASDPARRTRAAADERRSCAPTMGRTRRARRSSHGSATGARHARPPAIARPASAEHAAAQCASWQVPAGCSRSRRTPTSPARRAAALPSRRPGPAAGISVALARRCGRCGARQRRLSAVARPIGGTAVNRRGERPRWDQRCPSAGLAGGCGSYSPM